MSEKLDWSKGGLKTRGGVDAVIVGEAKGYLIGYLNYGHSEVPHPMRWRLDGKVDGAPSSAGDLVPLPPPPRKLEGWVNVYVGNTPACWIRESKEAADNFSRTAPERIACLDLSKFNITFTPGEGL